MVIDMGFWDREVRNSFDAMFDFNRDGHLDFVEQATQFDFFEESIKEDKCEDEEDILDDLDLDELEDMDEEERREAIEDAGYDPDDFDDWF